MKKFDWSGVLPLGISPRQAPRVLISGLTAGVLVNCIYLLRYASAYDELFRWVRGKRVYIGGVVPTFRQLLDRGLYGCWMAMLAMAPLAWYYWRSHYWGSKSIYTMRRLPDGSQLRRRCLTVPLLGAAVFFLEAMILWQLDFLIYWFVTPETSLPSVHWTALWSLW